MHKNCILKLYGTLGAIVASSILLQGCVAAAIPLALGASTFGAYKSYQLSTGGGEVQITFERETYTPEEKAALAQIRSMAIIPLSADAALEVAMAETLSTAGTFQVITPSMVLQKQSTSIDATNFNTLTNSEKTDVIRSLCRDLDVDGLVYARLVGSEVNTNMWSFSRPNMAYQIEMNIFSSREDQIIIFDKIKAKIVMGGGRVTTDMSEANRVLGGAMAERIQSAVQ